MTYRRRAEHKPKLPGKSVIKWTFKFHGGDKIVVDARMLAGPPTKFFVRDDTYGLSLENANLDELRRLTKEHLERTYRVDWEAFLRIAFDANTIGDDENEIRGRLDVTEIEIGTRLDGSKCWREKGRTYTTNGEPDEEEYDPQGSKYGDFECRSLVPATPENKAAVQRLQASLTKLHVQLLKALGPKQIAKTLKKPVAEIFQVK
jgi:hypothetical protein